MLNKIEKRAFHYCTKNKQRYTEPRRQVLNIIAKSKNPIKAYEILEKLKITLCDPKPPTIYRAIDFWLKHNFIHRIETLNAYAFCVEEHLHKGSQFLICNDCGRVFESHLCDLAKVIKETTFKNSFQADSWNLEINGKCGLCS